MRHLRMMVAVMLALVLAPFGQALAAGDSSGAATRAAGDANVVVDPNTMGDWESQIQYNTANVGRIWTDKTVSDKDLTASDGSTVAKGNASFLTALSALSSTSSTTFKTNQPLDVVLVLDASGSMDDSMGNGNKTKRIDALKTAANSFINKIAEENKGISNAAKQHQVSLVKFAGASTDMVGNDTYTSRGYRYNFSQVMKTLAPCTEETKGSFTDLIGGINPAGSTRADFGLNHAQDQLQSQGREGAKKVVVFFADGSPTDSNGFESSVASSAVDHAKTMKAAGADIYSIGIFSGANASADPTASGTSDENKFMHAVSSNYPTATYSQTGRWIWNLGDRAKDADGNDAQFYKSASTADELNKIFDDIAGEITHGVGLPTKVTEGADLESGYITFNDPLGQYMEVKDLAAITVNGQTFTEKTTSKATEGKNTVTTYSFSGTTTMNGKEAELSKVIIKVTSSADLKTGDVVEVKVPAGLIPLRNFNVDTKNNTMSVNDAHPINIFYTSGLKEGASDLLADPDEAMQKYLADNTKDGQARFYANDWNRATDEGDDKWLGKVVAKFEPAAENNYYFFARNTPIYTDEACTQRAMTVESGKTYYYKHVYYTLENAGEAQNGVVDGTATEQSEVFAFKGGNIAGYEDAVTITDEGAFVSAGMPRLNYITDLYKEKTENPTETVGDVLNPRWTDKSSMLAAKHIASYLGNNGRISVEVGGTLTVTKKFEGPALDQYANEQFTFRITDTGLAGKSFKAQVKDANGNSVGNSFQLSFGEDGTAQHSLKAGETLYVYGLSANTEYTVEELDSDLFAIADESGTKGTIVAGGVANAVVKNRYVGQVDYKAAGGLNVSKTLTGHDMADGQFKISVTPQERESADALGLPLNGSVISMPAAQDGATVTKSVLGNNDVVFTKANIGKTYTYKIVEQNDGAAGYTYDSREYTVTITVDDNNGLEVKTTVSGGDQGDQTYTYKQGSAAANGVVVPFSNSYAASGETGDAIVGKKVLEGRPLSAGEFSFALKIAGSDDDVATAQNDADGKIDFGKLSYTTEQLESLVKKYPNSVTKQKADNGATVWTVSYVAYEKTDDLPAGVSAQVDSKVFTVEITDNGDGTLSAQAKLDGGLNFKNAYKTEGPAEANLNGVKLLDHANGLVPGDIAGKFTFTVTSDDENAPMPEKTEVKNDAAGNVDFGAIKFTLDDLNKALVADEPSITNDEADKADKAKADKADETGDKVDGKAQESDADSANEADKNASDDKADSADDDKAEGGAIEADADKSAQSFELGVRAAFADEPVAKAGTARSHVFTYKITETGSADGVTNDSEATKEVSFKVTDDGSGNLSVERLGATDLAFTFVNSYDVDSKSSSVTDQIEVTKSLEGRDMKAGEFKFELVEGDKVVAEGTNSADGKVTMDSITYTKPGTHSYVLREVQGNAGGVTYDTHSYNVVTTVTDKGDGTLSVEHKLDGADTAVFNNAYGVTPTDSSVTDQVKVTKALDGRDLKEGEFTFELVEGNDVVASGTNSANGEVVLSPVTYTKPGTYEYLLREAAGNMGGITYDQATFKVVTTVVDNGDGTLSATHKLDGVESAVFTNTYNVEPNESSVTDQVKVTKTLEGRDMKEGEFNFELVEGSKVVATGSNSADGTVTMSPVKYTQAGEHTYVLREVQGNAGGVSYDGSSFTVKTTVTDKGDGTLGVTHELSSSDADSATFKNTYKTEPKSSSVTDQIEVAKTLEGRDMKAGEFSFELVEGDKVVATGTNSVDGAVTMNPITYTEAGEHTYVLREANGGTQNAGVTYDGTTYTVKTSIVDNGEGELVATHKLEGAESAAFNNTYKTEPTDSSVTDQVKVTKSLEGRDMKAGEFSFELVENDEVVASGINSANGEVVLSPITYYEPGEYTYVLREVQGDAEGITYDERTYTVNTTVVDNGDGTLGVTHKLDGADAAEFVNAYQEPEEPIAPEEPVAGDDDQDEPAEPASVMAQTGDVLGPIAVAVAALAAISGLVLYFSSRRKRN